MACPVCQDLTPTDLCAKCRGMSQKSAVILTTRMHRWERTYQHLAEVSCQDCCHVACSLCQSEITQFSNFFIYFSDLSRLFWFSWYQVTLCVFGLPGILQARAMYTWPEVIWTFQEDPWQFVTTRRPRQQLAWAHKEESWIDDDDNKKDLLHPVLGWWYFNENTRLRIVACLCWVSNGTNCNLIFFLVKKLWLI